MNEINEDFKVEFESLADWKILILTDGAKTPSKFRCKNCEFLNEKNKPKLPYTVIQSIPYDNYARKIIGYLYAIENGAEFIYDMDGDNGPTKKSNLDSFDYTNMTTSLIVDSKASNFSFPLINPYSHFGRPDIWPRGFPSQLIDDAYSKEYDFQLCDKIRTPIIQQGLVGGEKSEQDFDLISPPFILPPGVYGPLNGQNTLFHYRAFWSLFLPFSLETALTDIWRGYWAQRLMHLTGDNSGYYGIRVEQRKFLHEKNEIYDESLTLVELLRNWNCSSNLFETCIVALTRFLARKKFLSKSDANLSERWLEDLTKIGYHFPLVETLVDADKSSVCRKAGFVSNVQHAKQIRMKSLKSLDNFCHPNNTSKSDFKISNLSNSDLNSSHVITNSFEHAKRIVLVVTFNKHMLNQNISFLENIPFLRTLYEPWFARVVFCGKFPENFPHNYTLRRAAPFDRIARDKTKFSYVSVNADEISGGYRHYACLHYVADLKIQKIDGYLLAADDALVNVWTPLDLQKVHFKNECAYDRDFKSKWQFWGGAKEALMKLRTELNDSIGENRTAAMFNLNRDVVRRLVDIVAAPVRCGADIFYVPQKMIATYAVLSKLFHRHHIMLEIAVGKILAVLGWMTEYRMVIRGDSAKIVDLQGTYFWGGHLHPYLCCWTPKMLFMHPIKVQLFRFKWFRKDFCNKYVTYLFEVVGNGQHRVP